MSLELGEIETKIYQIIKQKWRNESQTNKNSQARVNSSSEQNETERKKKSEGELHRSDTDLYQQLE